MAATIDAGAGRPGGRRAPREGERAAPVVTGLVDRIEALVGQAEAEAAAQTDAIRDRFTRRMNELAGEAAGRRSASCRRPPPWPSRPTCARSWTG